jgi:type II secretory pathway component PulF
MVPVSGSKIKQGKMALYYYQAVTKDGKKVSGNLDASTMQGAREQLIRQGLYPTKVTIAKEGAVPWYKRILRRQVTLKDKIFFTKQLAVLLKSGIPLVAALDLLIEQTTGPLNRIVISLRDGIKEGKSLADGIARFPETFDSIYLQLVRAGEATGNLEAILTRLTDFLERRDELKKKISGALRYPLIQLVVITLVVIGLLSFVVPQIADVFKGQNIPLPWPTRFLMAMSNFLLNHYILLFGIFAALVALFLAWKSTPKGAYQFDKWKLKLPLIGYFSRMGAIVQFTNTLGMLVEGGVNLAESLNIVTKIVDNRVLRDALEQAKENIIKQGKIAQYLKEAGIFPPVAIHLINTGEQSGELGPMLLTVGKYFEDDLREQSDALSTMLGPAMLIVMFVIVGFVIAAILLPIQQIQTMAQKLK